MEGIVLQRERGEGVAPGQYDEACSASGNAGTSKCNFTNIDN